MDSYITVSDATTYVTDHYTSTDNKATAWIALEDVDREIYLRRAAQIIDSQPIVGIKADPLQPMAFPRITQARNGAAYVDTPEAVKHAQVEIALQLVVGVPKRVELQRQGVQSFSVGKLSENYGAGKSSPLPYEAQELLRPYLVGSVPIC